MLLQLLVGILSMRDVKKRTYAAMKKVKCVKLMMKTVGVIAITSAWQIKIVAAIIWISALTLQVLKKLKQIFFLICVLDKIKCITYEMFLLFFDDAPTSV